MPASTAIATHHEPPVQRRFIAGYTWLYAHKLGADSTVGIDQERQPGLLLEFR